MHAKFKFLYVIGLITLLLPISVMAMSSGSLARVSVNNAGGEGMDNSNRAKISGNGQFVVYESYADNLVPNDTNNNQDIFLFNRQTETTTRISLGMGGAEANGNSSYARISDDGCIVAFLSSADNLVPNDTNGRGDVFAYDCMTGLIERISVASDGSEADNGGGIPAISGDGEYIAFTSTSTNLDPIATGTIDSHVYLAKRGGGNVSLITKAPDGTIADWSSYAPVVSDDGRFVAFHSLASNLVPTDANGRTDVFVYDSMTGATALVSVDSNGIQGSGGQPFSSDGAAYAAISGDGRYISFMSHFPNLVPNDTNGFADVFIRDRMVGSTTRISVDNNGNQQNANSYFDTAVSDDGRFVAFTSGADNLVPNDTNNQWDIFVGDTVNGTIERVSVSDSGAEPDSSATQVSISDNGMEIAFNSYATNLVPNDTNSTNDVFVFEKSVPTAVDGMVQSTAVSEANLILIWVGLVLTALTLGLSLANVGLRVDKLTGTR